MQPLHNLSATLVLGDQRRGLLTECTRSPAFIMPLSACVSGAASGCVCFFLCLRVSVRLCVSVYVGLSRRAQCDKELGAVGRREGISKPQISPSGISGDLYTVYMFTCVL